jgi:hypothetical protein
LIGPWLIKIRSQLSCDRSFMVRRTEPQASRAQATDDRIPVETRRSDYLQRLDEANITNVVPGP